EPPAAPAGPAPGRGHRAAAQPADRRGAQAGGRAAPGGQAQGRGAAEHPAGGTDPQQRRSAALLTRFRPLFRDPPMARKKAVDFETSLAELQTLVERLESGELSLEDSLGAFEQGIRLTRDCQAALAQAEQKV